MKFFPAAAYILLFSFGLYSGDFSKKNASVKSDSNKNEYVKTFIATGMSIYDSVLEKYISPGMSKEEIDNILGTPEDANFLKIYNYQGLGIYYRNNIAKALIVEAAKNETARFKTSKKIGLGHTRSDIIKAYGNCIEVNNKKFLNYYFKKKGNSLVQIYEMPKHIDFEAAQNLYNLSYLIFDNDNVSMFVISDYQYAMSMQ